VTTDLDLLKRFCPLLRLDSHEDFPPCSPETFVSCPRVTLKRADGEPLAWSPELSLAFLGPDRYANGDRALGTDVLGHDGKEYDASMREMLKERPELLDVIYGRVVKQGVDQWLQYWMFYFYNGGLSRHEGDWEYIQVLLRWEQPIRVALAQHRKAEKVPWVDVETQVERPVLYVAQSTHATYRESGRHDLDVCDGKGRLVDPHLEVMPTTGWPLCKARIGDTRGNPDRPWETTSPPMPGRTRQWSDASGWAAD
jgi:hypothetical protein